MLIYLNYNISMGFLFYFYAMKSLGALVSNLFHIITNSNTRILNIIDNFSNTFIYKNEEINENSQ